MQRWDQYRNGMDPTEAEDIKKRWQEYWSGLPFPFPGDLPDPGIEPGSPSLQADSLPSEPSGDSNHLKGRGAWWSAVHGVLKSQA